MENLEDSLSFERCHEFPALQDVVYLDHVGATLVSRSQLEAHQRDILNNVYGNPHSRSQSSQLSTDTIDQVRYRILQFFGTTSEKYSVIFTAGCTAALKLVAESFDYHGNQDCYCRNVCNRGHSNSCYDNTDHCNEGDSLDGGQKGGQHESAGNFGWTSRKGGSFSYLLDNHTSVLGMREIAFEKAGLVLCLDCDSDESLHIKSTLHKEVGNCTCGNHLFAFPAQSNFSGRKYPLNWLDEVKNWKMNWQKTILESGSRSPRCQGHFYTVLDAASFVSTSPLDLGCIKPDFVTLSFYKMFGYPTGLGALLIKNSSGHVLKKSYFGGGTVAVNLPSQRYHESRSSLSDKFEDGTVSYLNIIALRHGFDALEKLGGGITKISLHTFNLAQYFHHELSHYCHSNGARLADIYCSGDFEDIQKQGAIVSFNLLRSNGEYVGFSELDKLAQLYKIHVRTGCFCNVGACQKFLGLSDDEIKHNFDAGHVCGDDKDLVDGKPTGAIRVSFGYMSTLLDTNICLSLIVGCFLETHHNPILDQCKQRRKMSKNRFSRLPPIDCVSENMLKSMPVENTTHHQSTSINSSTKGEKNNEGVNSNKLKEKAKIVEKSETELLKEAKESKGKLEHFNTEPMEAIEETKEVKEENTKVIEKSKEITTEIVEIKQNFDKLEQESDIIKETANELERNSIEIKEGNIERMYLDDAIDTCKSAAILSKKSEDSVPLKEKDQSISKDESSLIETFASQEGKYLSEIYLYPVKSCAAFKVHQWPVCDRGLLYDREWMVVTESGIAMSQKRESRLCLLQPTVDLNKCQLTLEFPGMNPINISLEVNNQTETETSLCNSKVCGDRVQSYDCGNTVAEWLSEALCRPGCRLIRQSIDDGRASKLKNESLSLVAKNKLSLANESQYLLISRDSVAALHEKILDRQNDGKTQECFDINNLVDRFRANIVVGGCESFEEETWSRIKIGNVEFKSQGICTRCQMVCLDQQTGERSKEPLQTLAVWRGTKVPFGIHLCNCSDLSSGSHPVIQVGEPVFVL